MRSADVRASSAISAFPDRGLLRPVTRHPLDTQRALRAEQMLQEGGAGLGAKQRYA